MVALSVAQMRELTQELSQLDYKKMQLQEKNRVLKAQVSKLKKQVAEGGKVLLFLLLNAHSFAHCIVLKAS